MLRNRADQKCKLCDKNRVPALVKVVSRRQPSGFDVGANTFSVVVIGGSEIGMAAAHNPINLQHLTRVTQYVNDSPYLEPKYLHHFVQSRPVNTKKIDEIKIARANQFEKSKKLMKNVQRR